MTTRLNARGNNRSPVLVWRLRHSLTCTIRSRHVRAGMLAIWMAAVPAAAWTAGAAEQPGQTAPAWAVEEGEVRIRCRLTIGGSFDATTSAISGRLIQATSGAASYTGELVIDLTSLDTGINLRDRHLRDTYLEVERGDDFATARLSGLRLERALPASAAQHKTEFSAELLLHGVRRPVAGDAELRQSDAGVEVRASFSVSLPEFNIDSPRYLGIGVRDEVQITVTFLATETATEPL